eukprot:CAMPEP_0170552732 /NCGR_PEP_ID=MMETSP0211-20121228/10619_1 /TAXON_ID=311385 /ORGANISM="Pseudokeronopsis sp., Strain OXSARD2" /LENGTH=78 /DNA_ID=CAMNT_0010860663 /DNA_START=2503 /DNA_END=2735 /DNA_ORIENTATION=-
MATREYLYVGFTYSKSEWKMIALSLEYLSDQTEYTFGKSEEAVNNIFSINIPEFDQTNLYITGYTTTTDGDYVRIIKL